MLLHMKAVHLGRRSYLIGTSLLHTPHFLDHKFDFAVWWPHFLTLGKSSMLQVCPLCLECTEKLKYKLNPQFRTSKHNQCPT